MEKWCWSLLPRWTPDAQVRTLESTLIQKWNPPLNYPFILKKRISKVGPDYSQSVERIASSFQAPGTRLHRKLRKRLHKLGALSLYSSTKQEPESSWMILTILAERTLASFDTQRELRSSAYALQHVYALYRLVNNLDEPPRSNVQSTLTKILLFKGGVKRCFSHPSLRSAVKKWLTSKVLPLVIIWFPFICRHATWSPAAHLSLSKLLVHHHRRMAEFEWDAEPPCNCQVFLQQHQDLESVRHPDDGQLHVASPFDKLNLARRLKFWMGVGAKTQVYSSFQQHLEQSWTQLEKWASRHLVFGISQAEWPRFLHEQWKQHVPGAKLPLSIADIKFVREITKECFVIQGEITLLTIFARVFTGAYYVPRLAMRTCMHLQP